MQERGLLAVWGCQDSLQPTWGSAIAVSFSSLLHGAQQPFPTSMIHQPAISSDPVDPAHSQARDIALDNVGWYCCLTQTCRWLPQMAPPSACNGGCLSMTVSQMARRLPGTRVATVLHRHS